jgi:TIR domain
MAETKPIQIFLCHASEDKAAVEAIYDRLKALGYKPWLDKKDLLPGQLWEEEIPKAIRASDFILIFLSKTSILKRSYVQTEFKLTLDAWMRIPQGMIHTIPVRLDDSDIPDQFNKFHWCNLFEADGFENLMRALQSGRPSPQGTIATSHPDIELFRRDMAIGESNVYEFQLRRVPQKRIGLITGDIRGVTSVDIWVNPLSTEMDLGRVFERTIAASIRYLGAKKTIIGHIAEDIIGDDLRMVMGNHRVVDPGSIIQTGAGELERTHNVKKIFHVAATQGQVGFGYSLIANIENCITNALAMVDHGFSEDGFRSILFPFVTKERELAKKIIDAAINYLQTYPQSSIEKAFFLTTTVSELEICKSILQDMEDVVALA